jgi:hypothetical protein
VTAERKQWKRFGLAAKETAEDSVTGAVRYAMRLFIGALLFVSWSKQQQQQQEQQQEWHQVILQQAGIQFTISQSCSSTSTSTRRAIRW